jgi:hypothetical protein
VTSIYVSREIYRSRAWESVWESRSGRWGVGDHDSSSGEVLEALLDGPTWLGILDTDFEVLDAPELATAIKELGDRYRAAERFR